MTPDALRHALELLEAFEREPSTANTRSIALWVHAVGVESPLDLVARRIAAGLLDHAAFHGLGQFERAAKTAAEVRLAVAAALAPSSSRGR